MIKWRMHLSTIVSVIAVSLLLPALLARADSRFAGSIRNTGQLHRKNTFATDFCNRSYAEISVGGRGVAEVRFSAIAQLEAQFPLRAFEYSLCGEK